MPDLHVADRAPDLRDVLFAGRRASMVSADIVADDAGMMAETEVAADQAAGLGLTVRFVAAAGAEVRAGETVMTVVGSPAQLAKAGDQLVGIMAKPSGIATAARRFVQRAGPNLRVVAGAAKKVPLGQKDTTRAAIALGGVDVRICPPPFVYLDKNYVTMLGGISQALADAAAALPGHRLVVQLGHSPDIAGEAVDAAHGGAEVVFVDTGSPADAAAVEVRLRECGLRDRLELAFGGGVRLSHLESLRRIGVDTVDVGRAIVDAPLLDMHLDIVEITP